MFSPIISGRVPNRRYASRIHKIIAYDEFTDTNGVAITSHKPDRGNSWLANRGTMDIQSNRVRALTYSSLESSAGIQTYVTDRFIISANAVSGAGGTEYNCGVFFRSDNVGGDSYWHIQISRARGAFEIVEPTGTIVATVAKTISANTSYALYARICGGYIWATIDGGNAIEYLDTTLANYGKTFMGVMTVHTSPTTRASIDNFKVETF